MSFRLKTILGIALIEVLVLAVLVVSSLHHLRVSNERELYSRARTTAQLLATMTSDAVISNDLATLDALIQQTLTNDGLVYARIRNRNGVVLSEGGEQAALSAPFEGDESGYDSKDGKIDLAAPIVVGGAEFGRVEMALSTRLVDAVVADGTRRMLTLASMEIVVVAIFGYLLGSILTRQLAHLRRGARRVAAGEFGYEMEVKGRDELSDTATSFNKMSAALADYAREVEEARRNAEAGRDYAETLLHNAMNSVSQAIFVVDPDGTVEFVNNAAFDFYDLEPDRIQAGVAFETVVSRIVSRIEAGSELPHAELVSERMHRLANRSEEQLWQTRQDDGRVILHSQRPVKGGSVVIIDTDVTDLYAALEKSNRLELELLQTHKLEALGTMASGVAHEINTPTQFIGDNVRFLSGAFEDLIGVVNALKDSPEDKVRSRLEEVDWDFLSSEIPAALSEAESGVQSIASIVRSIKEFAYPDDTQKQDYDLGKLVENAATMSRSQWRHSAELAVHSDLEDAIVACYPGELSQVLINLIVNAADAIAEDAENRADADAKGRIDVTLRRSKDAIFIDVADDGCGIPEDALRRIFDMFYTTKAPGKGTGQGLAICKSIIESKHSGRLRVRSESGAGTVFSIELPAERAEDQNPVDSEAA